MKSRDAAPPLGAHVSSAGGVHKAPPRAVAIGANAMQVFTKQASRWAEHLYDEPQATAWSQSLAATDVKAVSVHDSYLINLASPNDVLRVRSLLSFMTELKRCRALRIPFLVSHPGNFMDNRAEGISRNAESLAIALDCVPGNTMVLLETTAGSGTAIGADFGELKQIIDRLPSTLAARVGVCVDTAHIFAAGYDLVRSFDDTWRRLEDAVGWGKVRMMHLNDSKAPLGSRRDRHELIGEGAIGEVPFRRIMNEERFEGIPKVIETPKLDDAEVTDRRMLERLRSWRE